MKSSVLMQKRFDDGSIVGCELVSNKNNCFGGNTKGNANWLVLPRCYGGKSYKVKSLIEEYKSLKERGFKVVGIY